MLGGSVLAIAAAVVSAAGLAVSSPATPAAPPAAASAPAAASLESAVLQAMNVVRVAHGVAPLKASAPLAGAAAAHSRQMAEAGYFAHESADGSAFWKRVARYYPSRGFRYWSVGENLLWASPDIDAAGAIELWLESPEHRKNMLDPRWREVGVSAVAQAAAPGAYKGLDVTIVTTDFGARR